MLYWSARSQPCGGVASGWDGEPCERARIENEPTVVDDH